MKNKKAKGVGRAGFLWSEGRDKEAKEAARTEGLRQRGKKHEGDAERKSTHREGGNGVLIFFAPTFRSAELLRSQLLSDWLRLQRVVD